MSNPMKEILDERRRQILEEGWTTVHDDSHTVDEFADAAECYMLAGDEFEPLSASWPWEATSWKPKDRRRNIIRGGALWIAAMEYCFRRAEEASEELRYYDAVRNNRN